MKCQQSVAIDLPQKALIWKDDKAQVWISYWAEPLGQNTFGKGNLHHC